MGQIRFLIPRPDDLPPKAIEQAYFAGMDGAPWESTSILMGKILTLDRSFARESGNLYCCWTVKNHGDVMLCTGSLMEREQPYLLPLELARGTLHRLRNQAAAWEMGGIVLPANLQDCISQAGSALGKAVVSQNDQLAATEHANVAMMHALDGIQSLANEYSQQMITARRSQQPRLATLSIGKLDGIPQGELAQQYLAAFNTALITPIWKDLATTANSYDWKPIDDQVQWCRDHGLRICMGPLVQLDRHRLPDWLYLWEDEFEEIESSSIEFQQRVIERYRGKVHIWYGAGRINSSMGIDLSDEQRLKLSVSVLDTCQKLDARTPTILGFDQPWAEYIARHDRELTPLHFADTLVRSELGMAGVGVEINLGYWPQATLPRDLLEISRMLDRWTTIGLPLVIQISLPSDAGADPNAALPAKPIANWGPKPLSPQVQNDWVKQLWQLLIAKQSVQGIIWNQWRDDMPHDFSFGGLVNHQGRPKPALATIAKLRHDLLE